MYTRGVAAVCYFSSDVRTKDIASFMYSTRARRCRDLVFLVRLSRAEVVIYVQRSVISRQRRSSAKEVRRRGYLFKALQ